MVARASFLTPLIWNNATCTVVYVATGIAARDRLITGVGNFRRALNPLAGISE